MYGLPDIAVSKSTIRSRCVRANLVVGPRGLKSPMLAVEPQLVQVIIQKAAIRQPLTCSQGLLLANSLIAGTDIERQVNEWREKYSYVKEVPDDQFGKPTPWVWLLAWLSSTEWPLALHEEGPKVCLGPGQLVKMGKLL